VKSLATLIKLQKTRVDEQRQHLAKLQERLDQIESQIAQLQIRKAREQVAAEQNAEARLTYGQFLKVAIKQEREMEKERMIAAGAVEAAHNQLIELFEEQKRYEIAEASRIEAEKHEDRRRETIQLDEVGSVAFERKHRT
jgi:flagellar biosynthesis chaperone FliJ